MANFPADCAIGKTYFYGPPFTAGMFAAAGDAVGSGGFSVGTTLEPLDAGGNSYIFKYVPNLAGLQVTATFKYMDNGGSSLGGTSCYAGIGIMPRNANTAISPVSVATSSQHRGSDLFRSFSCSSSNFTANLMNLIGTGCTPLTGVEYLGTVTLTVGNDIGANKFVVTARLQIPALGVDLNGVYDVASGFVIDNSGLGVDGYVTITGPLGVPNSVNYFKITSFYITGTGLASACLGPTPAPFPDLKAAYPGNPAACAIGKKTSYYLDEFDSPALSPYWELRQGTFYATNGYATMAIADASDTVLEMKWRGKILNFDPADTLSLEIAGRVDNTNVGTGSGGYDALTLKIRLPDHANWALIKLQRDPTNSAVYKVWGSESWGSDTLLATPAFTGYPLDITLRIDVTVTGLIYFVNGVNIASRSWPIGADVTWVLPRVYVGYDSVHRTYLYYFYVSGSPGFPDLCEGASSARIASYRNMLVNLLPQGFPWRNLNQLFRIFLTALGVEMDRVHGRADDLLTQSNPGTATIADLLPEWETEALLPDELPAGGETQAQRQAVVAAKVTTHYSGQSRQFFIDLAASLGITIEIQEYGISASARSGTARSGSSRVGSVYNVFVWNIRFLMDTFSAATPYWVYDGDQDFTTYPGSITPKAATFSTDLVFQGGPLSPAFPVVPMSATYPLKFRFQLRTFFNGATNRAFAIITWAEAADFSTDFVSFIFGYLPGTPGYSIDVSGTRAGVPGWADFQTIPAAHTDPLLGNFDILITITTTGFQIYIQQIGYTYTGTGFLFPNIRWLDISLQRADSLNYSVLDGARIYTDAPNPSSPITKFQAMVDRLKPSHTQVTYT